MVSACPGISIPWVHTHVVWTLLGTSTRANNRAQHSQRDGWLVMDSTVIPVIDWKALSCGWRQDGRASLSTSSPNERDAKLMAPLLITQGHQGKKGKPAAQWSHSPDVSKHTQFLSLSLCILIKLALIAKTVIASYTYPVQMKAGVCNENGLKRRRLKEWTILLYVSFISFNV